MAVTLNCLDNFENKVLKHSYENILILKDKKNMVEYI